MQQAQKKQNGVILKGRLTFFTRTRAQHPAGSLAVLVEDPKRVIVAVTNRLVVGKARGGNLA